MDHCSLSSILNSLNKIRSRREAQSMTGEGPRCHHYCVLVVVAAAAAVAVASVRITDTNSIREESGWLCLVVHG
jgi:hypothetical protein